jgi:hypothetical protein
MGIEADTVYYIRRAVRYEEENSPCLQWVALHRVVNRYYYHDTGENRANTAGASSPLRRENTGGFGPLRRGSATTMSIALATSFLNTGCGEGQPRSRGGWRPTSDLKAERSGCTARYGHLNSSIILSWSVVELARNRATRSCTSRSVMAWYCSGVCGNHWSRFCCAVLSIALRALRFAMSWVRVLRWVYRRVAKASSMSRLKRSIVSTARSRSCEGVSERGGAGGVAHLQGVPEGDLVGVCVVDVHVRGDVVGAAVVEELLVVLGQLEATEVFEVACMLCLELCDFVGEAVCGRGGPEFSEGVGSGGVRVAGAGRAARTRGRGRLCWRGRSGRDGRV